MTIQLQADDLLAEDPGLEGPQDRAAEACEVFNEEAKLFERASVAFRRSVHFHNTTFDGQLRVSLARTVYPGAPRLALPTPMEPDAGLASIHRNRRSCRHFSARPVSMADISNLLSCLKVIRQDPSRVAAEIVFAKRAYPTPGGICSIDHYLLPLGCSDLPDAAAHYDARTHDLALVVPSPDPDMVRRALAPGVEIRPLPALAVVQVINIRRIVTKYRQRGYRFALIEAGLAAQTLCQMATSFGLGALMWGGFREHLLDPLLELDGVNTSSVGVIFVGHPAGS